MELLGQAVDRVTELVQRSSNEDGAAESCDSGMVARGNGDAENTVHFTDDLRTEDFKYIMDESSECVHDGDVTITSHWQIPIEVHVQHFSFLREVLGWSFNIMT